MEEARDGCRISRWEGVQDFPSRIFGVKAARGCSKEYVDKIVTFYLDSNGSQREKRMASVHTGGGVVGKLEERSRITNPVRQF
jgi:hypothetical protein